VLVAAAAIPANSDRGAIVRGLVRDADAASSDWSKATTVAVPDGPDALDTERRRWRAVARALEAARDEHPKHLGIQRDLVIAYSRLLPLAAGTPTASTIAALLPRTIRALHAATDGHSTPATLAVERRAYALLYLQTGPHVLAMLSAAESPDDEELAKVKDLFAGMGYGDVERLEPVAVTGGIVPVVINGAHAAGEPKVPGVFFDRLTFLVSPADDREPFDTFYVLSGRLSPDGAGTTRWALYGLTAGARRLLRLYGPTEPDGVLVRDAVRSLVERSLRAAKPASSQEAVK
jgi:hypothetical protein